MVISCFPDGTVQHLLKDEFLSPCPDQKRNIERITSIEFDEERQKFFVRWLLGPLAGSVMRDLTIGWRALFFDTYGAAVDAEIERVNAYRLSGVSFEAPTETRKPFKRPRDKFDPAGRAVLHT